MSHIQVGVVMGSSSDWDTMQHAVQILQQFGVGHEARVMSAHRMPDDMFAYAESAAPRGLADALDDELKYEAEHYAPPEVGRCGGGERLARG